MDNQQKIDDTIYRASEDIARVVKGLAERIKDFPNIPFVRQEYPEQNPGIERTQSYIEQNPGIVLLRSEKIQRTIILTPQGIIEYHLEREHQNLPLLNFPQHFPINYVVYGGKAVEILEELIKKAETGKSN